MDHLERLESQSILILREAYREFKPLGMLWSIGKDSTVLLYLTRKAFFGYVPFDLIHIDTAYKIPQMIEYRDNLTQQWKLSMVVGKNEEALKDKQTFPDGKVDRINCCRNLKSEALTNTLSGKCKRYRFNHDKKAYEVDKNNLAYTGIIAGIRADEEGSRSKERYFSPRDAVNVWDIGEQPPELWNQFNTDFAPGTHVRIHPLLDWTELNVWEYIAQENIPVVPLYFNHGEGKRYRSLGCWPCTKPVESDAVTVGQIIDELRTGKFSKAPERAGREQDREGDGTLETLRREGYM
jgi:sulfate adenylyltransferase subunit 2